MDFLNITAIAVALAMDAFAVSIAAGVTLRQISFRQVFRLSWHFGLFSGHDAGHRLGSRHDHPRHHRALCPLGRLRPAGLRGGNMIREALGQNRDTETSHDPTRGMTMVMLSVATSIDALAVGLSLSMLHIAIWTPALIIGLVAGLFTITGMHLESALPAQPI